jgi:hypothetical protein
MASVDDLDRDRRRAGLGFDLLLGLHEILGEQRDLRQVELRGFGGRVTLVDRRSVRREADREPAEQVAQG